MSQKLRYLRDEVLARRCQLGEVDAFAELVRQMERPLLYFLRQFLRDDQQALDVLQDVWIKVIKSIHQLREPSQLRCWLYQQARSLVVDQIRQQSARMTREQLYASERPQDESATTPVFHEGDAAEIHQALSKLTLPHREVLVLHFLEEWSISEVASILGCPPGTVKSRLFHAKQALAAILKERKDGR